MSAPGRKARRKENRRGNAMGKFVIRAVSTGVKFDLRAGNGEPVAASEVYATRAACLRGIESVRRNAPRAALEDQTGTAWKRAANPKFELYRDKSGAYRFRLKARNGAIIAVSGGYGGKAACLAGIDRVRFHAPAAEIEETIPAGKINNP